MIEFEAKTAFFRCAAARPSLTIKMLWVEGAGAVVPRIAQSPPLLPTPFRNRILDILLLSAETIFRAANSYRTK
jgi:hypothetical protein